MSTYPYDQVYMGVHYLRSSEKFVRGMRKHSRSPKVVGGRDSFTACSFSTSFSQGSWPALTRDWIMEGFICLDLLYSFVHRIHPFGANLRSSLKFSIFKFFTKVMYLS